MRVLIYIEMYMKILILCMLCCSTHAWFAPMSATLNTAYAVIQNLIKQQPTAFTFPAIRDAVNFNTMIILDVREMHDVLNQGKIPNTHNIPVRKLSSAFRLSDNHFEIQYGFKKPHRESHELLIVGDDATVGRNAIMKLRMLGYWNAAWYPGGFKEWVRKGGKVKKDVPKAVTFEELQAGLASGNFLVIDIRIPVARNMFGIIPNSVNIPVTEIPAIFENSDQEFERTLGFKKPSKQSEKTLVLLGTEGTSAEETAEKLQNLGYKNVKVFPGGFREWKSKKGPVAYPKPKVVVFSEVQSALTNPELVVIDVRERREIQKQGRIPGSYNIPLSQLPLAFLNSKEDFKRLHGFDLPSAPGDNIIITGGQSNRRGRSALRRLRAIGYTTPRLYDASFSDWVAKGGQVITETTQPSSYTIAP